MGLKGAENTVLAPSTREQASAVTHVQIRPPARALASPREAGDGRVGRGRHKPGANAILDKGASGWVAESADAVRARAPGGS